MYKYTTVTCSIVVADWCLFHGDMFQHKKAGSIGNGFRDEEGTGKVRVSPAVLICK